MLNGGDKTTNLNLELTFRTRGYLLCGIVHLSREMLQPERDPSGWSAEGGTLHILPWCLRTRWGENTVLWGRYIAIFIPKRNPFHGVEHERGAVCS